MPDGPLEGCASSGIRLRRRISSGSISILAAASQTSPSVMADRAVLAHDILVLEHDTRAGAVIRTAVRSSREIHDLVRFDPGRAGIDGVGTDTGEIVDLPGGDRAVVLYADPGRDAVIARVNVGDEALDAVRNELDRTLQQFGQRHYPHLVGIGVHLDAE